MTHRRARKPVAETIARLVFTEEGAPLSDFPVGSTGDPLSSRSNSGHLSVTQASIRSNQFTSTCRAMCANMCSSMGKSFFSQTVPVCVTAMAAATS